MSAKNFVQEAMNEVHGLIRSSMEKAMANGQLPQAELPNYTVEIPGDTSHGDFATNAAMVSARAFRNAPAKIAAILLENMDFSTVTYVEKAEIAGPGFINFFVKEAWFASTVSGILEAGKEYGNRLIMMHEGRVVVDIEGEEKKRLTVHDLLEKFEISSDRMLLGK